MPSTESTLWGMRMHTCCCGKFQAGGEVKLIICVRNVNATGSPASYQHLGVDCRSITSISKGRTPAKISSKLHRINDQTIFFFGSGVTNIRNIISEQRRQTCAWIQTVDCWRALS